MKKNNLVIISIFIIFIFLLFLFFKNFGSKIINSLPSSVSLPLKIVLKTSIGTNFKRVSNDYNEVFLPKTQFVNLNFKKSKLDFLKLQEVGYLGDKKYLKKSFFIEKYNDKLFIADKYGNFFYNEIENLKKNTTSYQKISTNLLSNENELYIKTLDIQIHKEKIFISKVIKKNQCKYLLVDVAQINYEVLNFKNIFTSESNKECMTHSIWAGKMEIFDSNQLLLTTAGDHMYTRNQAGKALLNENESDSKPQDDNSLFGKVLTINIENSNYQIFNKGHRNSIGLHVDGSIILSTENGPRGGDEINLEVKGKNYGWDLAAYGKKYYQNKMYLDHESSNYQEPIFAFVPSLAVTEIVKLGNNFTNEWQDNYLVGSLNGRKLLRVKFSQDKSKVIYIEKIFIGERIRDLLYDEKSRTILLALEDTGSIGVLYKD